MRKIIVVLLLSLGFTYASAQEVYTSSGKPGYHKKTKSNKGYDPSKLVLGGGLNAGFGGGYAAVGLAPIVGYKFTNHFIAGVGLGYMYYQMPDDNFYNPYKVYYDKENIVYPNLWARYFVWRGLYLTGAYEYDFIHLTYPNYDNFGNQITSKENVNAQCLLFGLGVKEPIGGRVSFFVELMYDFLQQKYSPYLGQPIFRGGIAAGL